MKTFGHSSVFLIFTIFMVSIQSLFANDSLLTNQTTEQKVIWVTNFGGGVAFGKHTNNYTILSELGYVKQYSQKYSVGFILHSEIDVEDNNRFGLNLVLRRKLKNQMSIDVGAGLAIYHISGDEGLPSFTTSLSFNANPDVAVTTRISFPRFKFYDYKYMGDELVSVNEKYDTKPAVYVGVLMGSKTGRQLNMIAAATAAVLGLLFIASFAVDND
ncbi:MAG: hypothetical protein R3C41_12085 [Calditrichia bacterium]